MTKEEIEARIAQVKEARFYLDMCDHWSREDYERKDELNAELRELEKKLLEVER